jgi:hypothetical protein
MFTPIPFGEGSGVGLRRVESDTNTFKSVQSSERVITPKRYSLQFFDLRFVNNRYFCVHYKSQTQKRHDFRISILYHISNEAA